MADLYRRDVIGYESVNKTKFRWNGQCAFFHEKCKIVSLIDNPRAFLERTGSPYSIVNFALPELVDIRNPYALNPLELQRNMSLWKRTILSVKILQAMDNIPGFLDARHKNDFDEMEQLFRENVLFYEKDNYSLKKEIAFLYEVANVRDEIEPMLKENKNIDPLQFYKAALPEFISHLVQKAYLKAEENKGLVYSMAKKYKVENDQEAIDKGFDALVSATLHFDKSLGNKFSTAACTYIRNAIKSYLGGKKDIGISLDEVFESSSRKEGNLAEIITYENDQSPSDISSESEIKRKIKSVVDLALSELSQREKEIIEARFGFGGEEPKTLEEIGKIFNVTKERIRQIEVRAIEKLKTHFEATGIDVETLIRD